MWLCACGRPSVNPCSWSWGVVSGLVWALGCETRARYASCPLRPAAPPRPARGGGGDRPFSTAQLTHPTPHHRTTPPCHKKNRSLSDVEIKDLSLEDYIGVAGKCATYLPHTAGRYQKKRFRKAQVCRFGVGVGSRGLFWLVARDSLCAASAD